MNTRPAYIAIVLLISMSWVCMLTGVAAYQNETDASNRSMRPVWWGVWFELALVLLSFTALCLDTVVQCNFILCCFAAMTSAYLMAHAEMWLTIIDGISGTAEDCAKVAVGGTVSVIISNWMLILALGSGFRDALVGV